MSIVVAGQCRNGDGLDTSSCDANSYLYSGFSLLQTALDTALIRVSYYPPLFQNLIAPILRAVGESLFPESVSNLIFRDVGESLFLESVSNLVFRAGVEVCS